MSGIRERHPKAKLSITRVCSHASKTIDTQTVIVNISPNERHSSELTNRTKNKSLISVTSLKLTICHDIALSIANDALLNLIKKEKYNYRKTLH